MNPLLLRQCSGFLFGLGVFVGPALAFMAHGQGPQPAISRHDYFPPPHLAKDKRFRIVAFGSSSTHGRGASSPAATYPAQLQRLLEADGLSRTGTDVVNRGIDGEDVISMLGRIDDDILPRRPDLVIWQLGSNDALHGVKPDALGRALRTGIAALRATGVPVVLIGPQWNPDPDRAALFARMNETMLAVSRAAGVPMIDRFALMQHWIQAGRLSAGALVGADGLHMTDEGYALLARAVFDTITTAVPGLRGRQVDQPPG